MAARFWVGGTGTWDATAGTKWSATSGTAGGASVPGPGDTVTFDNGAGGSGVVTVNTTVAVQSITITTFVGTLDFATNNNNVTLSSGLLTNGTSARVLNMGSGTWTFTTVVSGTLFDFGSTVTNFTFNPGTCSIVIAPASAPTGAQVMGLNPSTALPNVTINMPAIASTVRRQALSFFNAGTVTNLTVTNAYWLEFPTTITVTNAFSINGGTSSQQAIVRSQNANSVSTISGGAVTGSWLAVQNITKSGTSFTATNSFDLGGNTSVTISGPAGGAKVIG